MSSQDRGRGRGRGRGKGRGAKSGGRGGRGTRAGEYRQEVPAPASDSFTGRRPGHSAASQRVVQSPASQSVSVVPEQYENTTELAHASTPTSVVMEDEVVRSKPSVSSEPVPGQTDMSSRRPGVKTNGEIHSKPSTGVTSNGVVHSQPAATGTSSAVRTVGPNDHAKTQPPYRPAHPSGATSNGMVHSQPVNTGTRASLRTVGPNDHGKKQPPDRPGHGTRGRQIALYTNYFPLRIPKEMTIYHYDVSIKPEKLSKPFNRKIFEYFQHQFKGEIQAYGAYDGSKSVYFARSIRLEFSKTFPYQSEGEKAKEYTITLKRANIINIDVYRVKELFEEASETMPALQALDVVLQHIPSLRMQRVGRSFFSKPNDPHALGMGREVWPGYYQSVKPVMGWKMLLNVDTAATAFYTEQSVFDFMCTILRKCSPRDANKPLSAVDRERYDRKELTDMERKIFSKEIKGLKIQVTHLPYPRKYKVIGVTQENARTLQFPRDDSMCTVENYFKELYTAIKHPLLPCLQVGQKERNIYLPIDVCIVVGQKCMKKLSDIQISNMIRHTAKPAHERQREIMSAVKSAGFQQDSVLREFGIGVDTSSMVEVGGRVLDPPSLSYKDGSIRPPPDKGCWDMRQHKFYKGATINNWVIICSIYRCNGGDCDKFSSELQRQANVMGMSMAACGGIQHLDRKCTMKAALDKAVTYYKDSLDLIIAIIDKKGCDYQDIKMFGDATSGKAVTTQCVLDSTVQKKCNPPTLGNICLKINAKLGGSNSIVDLGTRPPVIRGVPIIIFGADVTHPRSDDTTSPSIASVVASIDLEGGKYRALHRNQKHRQEIIADLATMAKDHLKAFYKYTRVKPAKIIFYRDGVSDGQFAAVRMEEIAALQQACMQLQRDYQPKITFIIVQKRHHTRFFPKNRQDASGKGNNIPPGTMVDRGITHPTQFDFYLCSHAAIQGTSRPCHYHVLWDDSDFTADELQCFSYQLCHMFWRCNRSVSYPAPTYYAHHDAAHARMLLQAATDASSGSGSIHSGSSGSLCESDRDSAIQIHEKRQDKMYFL